VTTHATEPSLVTRLPNSPQVSGSNPEGRTNLLVRAIYF
jgi:hypothetical protein